MPEDDPDACTGEAARKVAEYIYGTFYSEAARARHIAPRIALSRLTARQYVESAAALIGAFTGAGKLDDQRGLKGRYFKVLKFKRLKKLQGIWTCLHMEMTHLRYKHKTDVITTEVVFNTNLENSIQALVE